MATEQDATTTVVDEAALAAAEAKEDAEFSAGFPEEDGDPPPEPAKSAEPEYVQITKKDWEDMRAVAAKTAGYETQLSKAFGTIGNMQKMVNGLQAATSAGRKVEIPADAFAALEKDFPELAALQKAAMEKVLAGIKGTGAAPELDEARITALVAKREAEREIEVLEDAHADWRTIVGAVDATKQAPDPNNAFRKWLATKDTAYQARVNETNSAAVIKRAIDMFQSESRKAAKDAKTAADAALRSERIAAAVQPRGARAVAGSGAKTDEEEFEAGFNSR